MADNLFNAVYNPDVLSCLANLSNDEVFTPPDVVNQMLDMLPQELFRNPDVTFLDPACKTGVFLREIAKRLLAGLEPQIPDLQERIDHIFHKQLYAIAITELTSLLSRRSVYCSKYPNSEFSVTQFNDAEGNIRFRRIQHKWKDGKCVFCSANKGQYERGDELETHAYEWIHTPKPEEIFKMKFDVIISNPPYQLSDGGNAASAVPIYQKFVSQAKKMNPRFLTMILPSRWFSGGRGLDEFRDEMLHDDRIRVIHDYPSASDCFPGVEIKGGICYFLWSRDERGLCHVVSHHENVTESSDRPLLEDGMDTFIRNEVSVNILHKVLSRKEDSFSDILNAGRYYGFHTKIEWIDNNRGLIQTADGKDVVSMSKMPDKFNTVKVYIHGGVCWINRNNIPKNDFAVDKYKVIIPRSGNPGSTILGRPKVSEPNSCSSNSYVVAINSAVTADKQYAENMISYLQTQFVRFLVGIKTTTQDVPPKAYQFVPMQDFTKSWTDIELYSKYGITDDEIAFIDSMIKPMDLNGGDDDAD